VKAEILECTYENEGSDDVDKESYDSKFNNSKSKGCGYRPKKSWEKCDFIARGLKSGCEQHAVTFVGVIKAEEGICENKSDNKSQASVE
jgi:hypothetical protein